MQLMTITPMGRDRSNAVVARMRRRGHHRTPITGKTYVAEGKALAITLASEDVMLLEIQ